MDPTKHIVPTAPVAGKIAGTTFTPEAQIQSETLTFRVLKDGLPERLVSIQFSPERAKTLVEGLKLIVRPEQRPGSDVPILMTEVPSTKPEKPLEPHAYTNGYAMTLELGRRDRGKLSGKISVSIPNDDKDYFAGTFTAEWVRPITELPGPDDAPFIQGKASVTGRPETLVKVGYVGLPKPGEFAVDAIEMPLVGLNRWARSDFSPPRVTTFVSAEAVGKAARYEHTHLSPARYFVYGVIPEKGPAASKWVTLTPDSQLTVDLTIDPSAVGSLEVTVPADTKGKVQLAPVDDPMTRLDPTLFVLIAASLRLEQEATGGVAKFAHLAPGKYEVRLDTLFGVVEIKAGETAKLELKK